MSDLKVKVLGTGKFLLRPPPGGTGVVVIADPGGEVFRGIGGNSPTEFDTAPPEGAVLTAEFTSQIG